MLDTLRYRVEHRDFWWLRRAPEVSIPTSIIEGRPGEGKTLCMTWQALLCQRQGVRVATNYTCVDRITGERTRIVAGMADVLRFAVECVEDGVPGLLALSEIHLWAESRNFKDTPEWFTGLCSQRRHLNVAMMGDTQDLSMVEKRFRIIVDQLVRVRRFRYEAFGRRPPLFQLGLLDPTELVGGQTVYDEVGQARWVVVPWWVYKSYDTRELVTPERMSSSASQSEVDKYTERLQAAIRPEVGLSLPEWVEYVRKPPAVAGGIE